MSLNLSSIIERLWYPQDIMTIKPFFGSGFAAELGFGQVCHLLDAETWKATSGSPAGLIALRSTT
jgi:hypothetical protein